MSTLGLTYEQNSVVNAVLTLIDSMDDEMRTVLIKRLGGKKKVSAKKEAETQADNGHSWMNYPISPEVMSMTFKHRKPVDDDYKSTLENELRAKFL